MFTRFNWATWLRAAITEPWIKRETGARFRESREIGYVLILIDRI